MKVVQSPLFVKRVKKFHKKQKEELDIQIKNILKNPELGHEKKKDLKGIYILKFKVKDKQFLLSYRVKHDILELIMIGEHENYYRNLKGYLKTK